MDSPSVSRKILLADASDSGDVFTDMVSKAYGAKQSIGNDQILSKEHRDAAKRGSPTAAPGESDRLNGSIDVRPPVEKKRAFVPEPFIPSVEPSPQSAQAGREKRETQAQTQQNETDRRQFAKRPEPAPVPSYEQFRQGQPDPQLPWTSRERRLEVPKYEDLARPQSGPQPFKPPVPEFAVPQRLPEPSPQRQREQTGPQLGMIDPQQITRPGEVTRPREIARPLTIPPGNHPRVEQVTGMGSDQFANVYALYNMENRSDKHTNGRGREAADAIVHVNKDFDPNKPFDVVFYNHGHLTSARDTYDNKGTWALNHNIGEQMKVANPQTILIVPAWQPTEGGKASTDGNLVQRGAYGRMTSEILRSIPGAIRDTDGTPRYLSANDVRSVAVISHSAGYYPSVNELADPVLGPKVIFVGALDTLYGSMRTGRNGPDGKNDFRIGVNAWAQHNDANFRNGRAAYLNIYTNSDNKIINSSQAQIDTLWPRNRRPAYVSVDAQTPEERPVAIIHSSLAHSNVPKYYFGRAVQIFDRLEK